MDRDTKWVRLRIQGEMRHAGPGFWVMTDRQIKIPDKYTVTEYYCSAAGATRPLFISRSLSPHFAHFAISRSPSSATSIKMSCQVTVTYPHGESFNMEYASLSRLFPGRTSCKFRQYINNHMPLAHKLWKPHGMTGYSGALNPSGQAEADLFTVAQSENKDGVSISGS